MKLRYTDRNWTILPTLERKNEMRESRRKEMADYIAHKQSASMHELCEVFGASINTVRADVAFLEQTGAVEKVYGGVRSLLQQEIPLFDQRAQLRTEPMLQIARAAVGFLSDGDTLFVDAGTTTMHLLELIPEDMHLTVITGNLHLVSRAYLCPNVELIVLPGSVNRRTNSVSDVSTLEFLRRYHFIKAVMAATGLSPDGRLNVSSYLDYEIKHRAVEQSEQCLLLCDSAKYGAAGLLSYATLADMSRLITDAACPEELRSLCEECGTALTIA